MLFKDILEAISLILRYRDNVVIQCGIFHYIYHIGCAFNLHSIINNGLIPGGQDFEQKTDSISSCLLIQETKVTKILNILTSLYHVERDTCKVHGRGTKTRYSGFDIDLAIREGLTFYQTRSNAIILQGTLPAYCIPKVERLKTGEVLHERRYLSPRPPPKISLKHDHNWTRGNDQLGSTVEQQPVGKLVQQSFGEASRVKFSKPTPIQTQSNL